jgi:hypothetical protein
MEQPMTTQPPAADSVSLSDAAVAQAFRERITINESPFVYHAVIDLAREIEALRERELDAGGGDLTEDGSLTYAGQRKVVEHMTTELAAAIGILQKVQQRAEAIDCQPQPTTPPAVEGDGGSWMGQALHDFAEYFAKNFPQGTEIYDPSWHAPKIFRNALWHIEQAQKRDAATPPGEAVSGDTHEERAHMQTIDERDHAYEIIDDILDLVLGSDRPEWSSAYDFTDAVHDVAEHVEALTKQAAQVGVNLATCDWPAKPFSVKDEPGEHDPCYLVMPDGSMVAFNHHAENGVDQARAQFVAIACNEALAKREGGVTDSERLSFLVDNHYMAQRLRDTGAWVLLDGQGYLVFPGSHETAFDVIDAALTASRKGG